MLYANGIILPWVLKKWIFHFIKSVTKLNFFSLKVLLIHYNLIIQPFWWITIATIICYSGFKNLLHNMQAFLLFEPSYNQLTPPLVVLSPRDSLRQSSGSSPKFFLSRHWPSSQPHTFISSPSGWPSGDQGLVWRQLERGWQDEGGS